MLPRAERRPRTTGHCPLSPVPKCLILLRFRFGTEGISPIGGLDSPPSPRDAYTAFSEAISWLRPSKKNGRHDVLHCVCR